jgi:putative N6-adenine-specific DNA methylase
MSESELIHFYVSCPPGLESILASEYHSLGLVRTKVKKTDDPHVRQPGDEETGGMEFEGSHLQVYLANLHMRTASRITLRLGEFFAITFAELRKKASKLDWEKYILPGQKVVVQAICHKSRLYHSDAVAERILGAINDHFSSSGKPILQATNASEGQLILVRLVNDQCTISVDSSGELLHKLLYVRTWQLPCFLLQVGIRFHPSSTHFADPAPSPLKLHFSPGKLHPVSTVPSNS